MEKTTRDKVRGLKLQEEILQCLGFHGEGKDTTNKPCYRIELQSKFKYLQMVIGDYPRSNPNSGIVSIYCPELKDQHCYSSARRAGRDKKECTELDHISDEDEDNYYGIKYITFEEQVIPIATHVNTVGRLMDIYEALTTKKLNLLNLAQFLK